MGNKSKSYFSLFQAKWDKLIYYNTAIIMNIAELAQNNIRGIGNIHKICGKSC